MSALRLGAPSRPVERASLERWVATLDAEIPSGDAVHAPSAAPTLSDALLAAPLSTTTLEHTREHVGPRHLGTLGGGNHFVELDRDAEGDLWLLVHSGSRGMGAAVAAHHARAAGDADDPFAALSTRSEAGAAYLADLGWALAFARANRRALAVRAADLAREIFELDEGGDDTEPIDVPHNFVARERWGERELYVHPKGAIRAATGELALAPDRWARRATSSRGSVALTPTARARTARVVSSVAGRRARGSIPRDSPPRCATSSCREDAAARSWRKLQPPTATSPRCSISRRTWFAGAAASNR